MYFRARLEDCSIAGSDVHVRAAGISFVLFWCHVLSMVISVLSHTDPGIGHSILWKLPVSLTEIFNPCLLNSPWTRGDSIQNACNSASRNSCPWTTGWNQQNMAINSHGFWSLLYPICNILAMSNGSWWKLSLEKKYSAVSGAPRCIRQFLALMLVWAQCSWRPLKLDLHNCNKMAGISLLLSCYPGAAFGEWTKVSEGFTSHSLYLQISHNFPSFLRRVARLTSWPTFPP